MRFISTSLSFWACLIIPTSARICEFPKRISFSQGATPLKSQAEADTLLKDCTTVTGDLDIERDYVGSLVVLGVTNFTGELHVYGTEVTEIVWSDVEYIDSLSVSGTTALHLISFPKLSTVRTVYVTDVHRLDIDLPVLTLAQNINLGSTIASLNAPLLFNVSSISIHSNVISAMDIIPVDGFNFSLPSLEYVDEFLVLTGNFTDIVLPKLKVISPPKELPYRRGAAVPSITTSQFNLNPVRNISLPSLVYAAKLTMNCHKSLSLPSLEQTINFEVTFANSTAVVFPALWNATRVVLSGQVTDVSFPALNHTDIIKVYGNGPKATNCTTVTADWERTNTTDRYFGYKSCMLHQGPLYCETFTCDWNDPKPPKKKKPLSQGDIAGICVGGMFSLAIVVLGLAWWYDRKKSKKDAADTEQRAREIEMDGVTITGDGESGERVDEVGVVGVVDERRDSKDTVVVDVNERGEAGQRS